VVAAVDDRGATVAAAVAPAVPVAPAVEAPVAPAVEARAVPVVVARVVVEARVVAVADVFDALTASRSYKAPWTTAEALGELARLVDAGRLDGGCVAVLERSADELDERLRGGRPDGGV